MRRWTKFNKLLNKIRSKTNKLLNIIRSVIRLIWTKTNKFLNKIRSKTCNYKIAFKSLRIKLFLLKVLRKNKVNIFRPLIMNIIVLIYKIRL